MELVYVSRAIKRYWWVTVLFIALGVIAGAALSPSMGEEYQTEARIQVLGADGNTSDDRDVQNQLVLLDSVRVARQVADSVGDVTVDEVRRSATFEQIPSSDVIRITVHYWDPSTAQSIANGYVDAYIDALRSQVEGVQLPDLEALDQQLADLEAQLQSVDQQIEVALAPWIATDVEVLPTIDQVDPALASQQQLLRDQYVELLRRRSELQLQGLTSELPSQTTQEAALPSEPIASSVSLRLIAGPFVGVLLGVLASLAIARLSPKILDAEEGAEILGIPLAGEMRRQALPEKPALVLTDQLPSEFVSVVHDLAVRAEANATSASLTIAVAGADRGAGSTTLAAGLARHFANQGAQTLLIDADAASTTLSRHLDEGVSGVRILLSSDPDGMNRRGGGARPRLHSTALANLRFAGLADGGGSALRRQDVSPLLESARRVAQVVIIDCGALMDSASSVQIAQSVDTVVVPFAPQHQTAQGLAVVARQLTSCGGLVLPIATPGRRGRPSRRPSNRSAGSPSPDSPQDEQLSDRPAEAVR